MTEQEWLNGTTRSLVRFLRPPIPSHLLRRDAVLPPEYQSYGSERKVRLFSCACCAPLLPFLNDAELEMHRLNEQFAEREMSEEEVRPVVGREMDRNPRKATVDIYSQHSDEPDDYAIEAIYGLLTGPEDVAFMAYIATQMRRSDGQPDLFHEDVGQRPLLHCIFGNPFRPVTLSASWTSSSVRALATAIYTDRAFDRLPILADALEDAGCTDAEILAHCRAPGPHVLGCWALDWILGKT